MLKTDYKGFGEFMEKIKTAGEEETRTLCGIRQQMWLNEISDFIFPTPVGDLPFLINALETLAQTIKKTNPEAEDCARKIINGIGWEVQTETINKNMSEAAAKAWYESVKNNKGIMQTKRQHRILEKLMKVSRKSRGTKAPVAYLLRVLKMDSKQGIR